LVLDLADAMRNMITVVAEETDAMKIIMIAIKEDAKLIA